MHVKCQMTYMSYFLIYVIYDMYGALIYTICMYVNMGVKRIYPLVYSIEWNTISFFSSHMATPLQYLTEQYQNEPGKHRVREVAEVMKMSPAPRATIHVYSTYYIFVFFLCFYRASYTTGCNTLTTNVFLNNKELKMYQICPDFMPHLPTIR